MPERFLCRMDELPDGGARGLAREGNDDRLIVIRRGGNVVAWLNDCPHEHRPLEYRRDRFLSADGRHIVCYAHSAHFDLETGRCFAGPCTGDGLTRIATRVDEGGAVWIPDPLPTILD